jgi:hypothetical protein
MSTTLASIVRDGMPNLATYPDVTRLCRSALDFVYANS